MLNALTKLAMIMSFLMFAFFALLDWGAFATGEAALLLDHLELPEGLTPSVWLVILGALFTLAGLAGLALAYIAIWRILGDGEGQDFRDLAGRLRLVAYGLIAFWLCNYLTFGGVRTLMIWQADRAGDIPVILDPFNIDIVLAIMAVAVLAISRMMDRAWKAEDETRHFL